MEEFLTEGQFKALEDFKEIEHFTDEKIHLIEVVYPEEENKTLKLEISVDCSEFKTNIEGSLPLRTREIFEIFISSDFPFSVPLIYTKHKRWANFQHIQFSRYICLYQSSSVEWNPARGLFQFLERLVDFIKLAGRGEFDSFGEALHPPIAYPDSKASKSFIFEKNVPKFDDEIWLGFFEFIEISKHCCTVTNFLRADELEADKKYGLCILTKNKFTYEFPEKIGDLLELLSKESDFSFDKFITCLQVLEVFVQKKSPFFIVTGSPMRGISGGELLYHLEIFETESWLKTGVEVRSSKFSEHEELKKIGEKVDGLIKKWASDSKLLWCKKYENRPEIVESRNRTQFPDINIGIIGAGALGSNVAELLVRHGIRRVTVWDKSTVHPGIICRQRFNYRDIGQNKAKILASNLLKIYPNSKIMYNQGRFTYNETCRKYFYEYDLVIDLSGNNQVPHVIEKFVRESNGKSPIFLSACIDSKAENLCCYYIPKDLGVGPRHFLRQQKLIALNDIEMSIFASAFWPSTSNEIFQPEPGCSEPTFVGGMIDTAQASNEIVSFLFNEFYKKETTGKGVLLFTQLGLISATKKKIIKELPVELEIVEKRKGYKVVMSPSANKQLNSEIHKGHESRGDKVENGGLLFGEVDENSKIIWVDYTSGPPRDSEHSEKKFLCGVQGTQELADNLKNNSNGTTQFLGTWHTHPVSMGEPSKDDYQAAFSLLFEKGRERKNILFLIVGFSATNRDVNAHLFNRNEFDCIEVENDGEKCLAVVLINE